MLRTKQIDGVTAHIATRIIQKRIEKGWSQADLAAAIGVTFQQVQKYEKALNKVSPQRLARIAEALGVELTWFFEGVPKQLVFADEMQKASEEIFIPNHKETVMLKAYRSLANADQRLVNDLLARLRPKNDA